MHQLPLCFSLKTSAVSHFICTCWFLSILIIFLSVYFHTVCARVCLCVLLLVEVRHGDPPLGLLHHVGLTPQADSDDGRRQLAGLAVHLHGDGLVGGEDHLLALVESLAVAAHLQGCLRTNAHTPVH